MTINFSIKLRALVVDDVPAARRVAVRLLQKIGVKEIHEAAGVQDALKIIEAEPINLLLSDVHLKDGKGTEILTSLADSPRKKQLKSVFMTSDMDKATFLEALEQGVSTYLLKPFSGESLEEKLKTLFPHE
jgi:CheY-like chemotaxis protein